MDKYTKETIDHAKELLKKTKPSDDVLTLTCIMTQMQTVIEELREDLESRYEMSGDEFDPDTFDFGLHPTTQIPDATCHRKYWEEFDADELIAAMEDKYKDVPSLEIPAEYDTSY